MSGAWSLRVWCVWGCLGSFCLTVPTTPNSDKKRVLSFWLNASSTKSSSFKGPFKADRSIAKLEMFLHLTILSGVMHVEDTHDL